MADAKDPGLEVAKAFFEAVLKQSELLGSWSLAVFGACVVLIAWHAQRRLESGGAPMLRGLLLVVACGACQGASILLMYLAYGQMVNLVPAVQLGKFETAVEFKESLSKAGFLSAQYLFATQFILFFAGVVLIGLFAILNYRLVGQAPPRVPPPPVVGT